MKHIVVKIRKPLYGTFSYIRGSIVEQAIREKKMLKITIPQGTAIMDPNDWKKNCRMMKKVFKFEHSPMVLYGNYVNVPLPKVPLIKPKPKEKEKGQQTLFKRT